MTKSLPFFLLLLPLLYSCADAEVKNEKNHSKDLYYDYQIWAEEDRNEVTIRLQYKSGDKESPGLLVQPPGRVLLDDVPLQADSSKFNGTYYELTNTVDELSGEHTVVFVDADGKQHREHFRFEPLSLAEELPEMLPKKPFSIRVNGLAPSPATVRLVIIDTSMESPDVNEEVAADEEGEIFIDSTMLSKLTSGPVTLELYREEERPIHQEGGGKLSMTFVLRRQFAFQ